MSKFISAFWHDTEKIMPLKIQQFLDLSIKCWADKMHGFHKKKGFLFLLSRHKDCKLVLSLYFTFFNNPKLSYLFSALPTPGAMQALMPVVGSAVNLTSSGGVVASCIVAA
jgi:hypothetical protein